MNQKKVTVLAFLKYYKERKVEPLTAEKLESVMESKYVNDLMTKIGQESDKEKQNELKVQLPSILYQCQYPENGVRPTKDTAIPSGFCMHDWDHMPQNPSVFYWENIAGREEELGIVFAHITSRGEGLRLVTTMKAGETITQCQERIATMFGMQENADSSIKDLSRISFLPGKKNFLYLNKEGLFAHEAPEVPEAANVPVVANVAEAKDSQKSSEAVGEQNVQGQKIAENFTYQGIKYSDIIEALLERIATMGKPEVGERNTDLYMLSREIRHICDYNFSKVYMLVAPYFTTLPDAEIRRTINSAIGTNGRTMTPTMKGILNELRGQNVDIEKATSDVKQAKLPKVSPVEEMIISKYPKYLRSNVFLSMLPLWGIYGTHVRFNYMDGRENSFSFMTSVVGKSGSGKAFAADLVTKMTKRFQAEDALERQKANEYLAQYEKAGNDTEKPDDPRPRVRLYSDDITTSQLLDYLDNLEGEHGFQFTEEIARLEKAKHTHYGDNDDLYCKSFDNGIGGKESKSKQTRNIRIKIFLNTLFCGTPGAMHKFYNNPEGGLNNRVIYAFMPKVRMNGFPHYGEFTEDDQKLFDAVSERLWQAGQDGNKVRLTWLENAICKLKKKWDKEDEENPDDVWYDLGKRALVVAFRVGVLEWLLRDCPEDSKSQNEIIKVMRWMAETMRQGVYAFSGSDYEEIAKTDTMYQQKAVTRMTKNKKLFSLLPEDFTIQDVITLRVQNGYSSDVYMVISRWLQNGDILTTSRGHYHKVKAIVA